MIDGTPMKQNQHVVVGRIGKSHGVHGWMRVQSFTEPPEQLLHYQPWYWDSNAKEPIAVTEQVQKGNHLLIKLVDCKDPETVRERYTNRDIIMLRDQLPDTEEDEYYWQGPGRLQRTTPKWHHAWYCRPPVSHTWQ